MLRCEKRFSYPASFLILLQDDIIRGMSLRVRVKLVRPVSSEERIVVGGRERGKSTTLTVAPDERIEVGTAFVRPGHMDGRTGDLYFAEVNGADRTVTDANGRTRRISQSGVDAEWQLFGRSLRFQEVVSEKK